jgi:hypothetical protein
MKQTAVEWYEKEINSLFEKYEAKQISQVVFLIMKHNIFYQAKEMEGRASLDDSEQYYNETFKPIK